MPVLQGIFKRVRTSEDCEKQGNGGEDEIRTHDTFNSIPAFQASAFNHSATSPQGFY